MSLLGYQHVGVGKRTQRVQVGLLARHRRRPAARQAEPGIGMIGQRLHHREDGAVFQKGQLAGAEVIEQCAERLGPDRHLWVQAPAASGIEHRPGLSLCGRRHGQ